MTLKGSKIYLKEGLREEDYPLILKGYTDLSVIGFSSFAKKAVALKTTNEAKRLFHEVEEGIVFGIYTYEDKFIGYSGLERNKAGDDEFSIYILDKNFWGKGIGKEASELILNYAFNELKLKKLWLMTSECHEKAIRLYEKMGFRKTKIIPNDREIYLNGKWISSGTVEMELIK